MESVPHISVQEQEQRANLSTYYDKVSSEYDEVFSVKADYQLPRLLMSAYERYGIHGGTILDLGCGTGKIKDTLGGNFQYTGIDLSEKMLEHASLRGYVVHQGAAEEVLKTYKDKSVDHIIALSSLYFIKDIRQLLSECSRVARESIFISLEQFSEETRSAIKSATGVEVYNHSKDSLADATEVLDVEMWKRPSNGEQISGYLLFKKLER